MHRKKCELTINVKEIPDHLKESIQVRDSNMHVKLGEVVKGLSKGQSAEIKGSRIEIIVTTLPTTRMESPQSSPKITSPLMDG